VPEKDEAMIEKLMRFFGMHVHERKIFCVGEVAFVKCVTCGDESIPWRVPKEVADAWHETHPEAMPQLEAMNVMRQGSYKKGVA
jgi:hypothetical protein